MPYDIFFGETSKKSSSGSVLLPSKQEKAIFNKIDDVRYDVRQSTNRIKIALLALSGAVALVAVSNIHRTVSQAKE